LVSPKTILWEVDVQRDFMLPGGKLYVTGAEKIVPNIALLTGAAKQGLAFLISSADAHDPDDAELREWPPHCMKGTAGAELLPEAQASPRLVIPNHKAFALNKNFGAYRQFTMEKNTLDVFDNPKTDELLAVLGPSSSPAFDSDPLFVVFGVATEYCVRCTAEGLLRRGRRLGVVTDAVRAIDEEKGKQILESLESRGVKMVSTQEALAAVRVANSKRTSAA
jgi:nicotinamidase/pyrazinamidase